MRLAADTQGSWVAAGNQDSQVAVAAAGTYQEDSRGNRAAEVPLLLVDSQYTQEAAGTDSPDSEVAGEHPIGCKDNPDMT